VAELVFPHVAKQPGGALRLADAWDAAYTLPWQYPSRADDFFRSVASVPELFERLLEEVTAPDAGALSQRTYGAFDVIANAADRRAAALAAIVARIRIDRGRPSQIVNWRADSYRALRKCGGADAVPTALLELSDFASVTRAAPLVEVLPRSPRGIELLPQVID